MKELWRRLHRVSIPVFKVEQLNCEGWKASFVACVDRALASSEYKLLQLQKYFRGGTVRAIENLDHSAEAYELAKRPLDRKFGCYMSEITCFKPIRGNPRDVEMFADFVDVALVDLKNAGRNEDLGNRMLYYQLV